MEDHSFLPVDPHRSKDENHSIPPHLEGDVTILRESALSTGLGAGSFYLSCFQIRLREPPRKIDKVSMEGGLTKHYARPKKTNASWVQAVA